MAISQSPSFDLFGEQHLLVMSIILALTIGIPYFVKKAHSEQVTQMVALSLASILMLAKVCEPIYRILSGRTWLTVLPLHLCDIGGFLICIMLINRNYFLYELAYFWALGGTVQAVLTPDLIEGYSTIDFLIYFVVHGLIIISVIYATVVFKYRPTLKSIWRTFLTTLLYTLVIIPVNLLLNTNFLYICRKPKNPSLLDYLGPWPWYVLSLAIIAPVIFFIYYSPFWISDLLRAHNRGNFRNKIEKS
ncbi:MAG: TIGR02206 family membrane protein [bacterium]